MQLKKAFSDLPSYWRLIDQPLAFQFWVAGGIVALASLINIMVLLSQVRSQVRVSQSLAQSQVTVRLLDHLQGVFYRQRATFFDFLETHDSYYLEKIKINQEEWSQDLNQLESYERGTHREKKLLEAVDRGYQSWFQLVSRFVKISQPLDLAELRLESSRIKDLVLSIDQIVKAQERVSTLLADNEQRQTRVTFVTIGFISILLLLVSAVVLSKLYVSLAQPLSDVLSAMLRYQEGDFSARVPVTNRGTIGFIEATFDEMAEKIELMVRDLKNLDELKSEFISTVSHELRTPLTSIGGYAKLLLAGDAGNLTEIQTEFLKIIDTNVVRLTGLINEILDVEALEASKEEVAKTPLSLVPILKECADTFRVVAQQKGLEIRTNVPEDLKAVLGEKSKFIRIFMNLISNAIKYTQAGYIEIRAEHSAFAVAVHVQDSGVGLTPEDQRKIFEKFYRVRSSLVESEGGSGLGLVIVRKLVESFGGSITVESMLGVGTQFTVTLPALVDVENEPVSLIQTKTVKWEDANRIIWLIDPHLNDREVMAKLIQTLPLRADSIDRSGLKARESLSGVRDFEVVQFNEVKEISKKFFDHHSPSAIILDPVREPQNLSLISEMRKKLRRQVPVLIASQTVDASLALAEGASSILRKPFKNDEFLSALRGLLLGNRWKMLLVDHNTDLRILLKRQFEQRGFSVDDSDQGNLVLDRLKKENYDLVLIEKNLPDVSGFEILRVIRKNPNYSDLFVFLMGDDDREPTSSARVSDFKNTYYLGKVDGLGGIVEFVCRHLEERLN